MHGVSLCVCLCPSGWSSVRLPLSFFTHRSLAYMSKWRYRSNEIQRNIECFATPPSDNRAPIEPTPGAYLRRRTPIRTRVEPLSIRSDRLDMTNIRGKMATGGSCQGDGPESSLCARLVGESLERRIQPKFTLRWSRNHSRYEYAYLHVEGRFQSPRSRYNGALCW